MQCTVLASPYKLSDIMNTVDDRFSGPCGDWKITGKIKQSEKLSEENILGLERLKNITNNALPNTTLGGNQIRLDLRKSDIVSVSYSLRRVSPHWRSAIYIAGDHHGDRRNEPHFFVPLGSSEGEGGGAGHTNPKLHKRTQRCNVVSQKPLLCGHTTRK